MPKIDTTVGSLVAMIKDGELRLPEMQRRYVWPATRVRDRLDSLYRGYPSGTILVWETDREMPSRDLDIEQGPSPSIEVMEVDEAPEDPNDTDLDATEGDDEQGPSLNEPLKLRAFVVFN